MFDAFMLGTDVGGQPEGEERISDVGEESDEEEGDGDSVRRKKGKSAPLREKR